MDQFGVQTIQSSISQSTKLICSYFVNQLTFKVMDLCFQRLKCESQECDLGFSLFFVILQNILDNISQIILLSNNEDDLLLQPFSINKGNIFDSVITLLFVISLCIQVFLDSSNDPQWINLVK